MRRKDKSKRDWEKVFHWYGIGCREQWSVPKIKKVSGKTDAKFLSPKNEGRIDRWMIPKESHEQSVSGFLICSLAVDVATDREAAWIYIISMFETSDSRTGPADLRFFHR